MGGGNCHHIITLQEIPDRTCHEERVSMAGGIRSDKKLFIAAIFGLLLPILPFPALTDFKIVCMALWAMNYFPPFSTDTMSLCRYFHRKCVDKRH